MINFKHKIHSWLRDSADKCLSKASSKEVAKVRIHLGVPSPAVAPSHLQN